MEAQTETEPTARALGKGWGRWAGPSTDDGRLDDLLQRDLLALCAAVTRSSAIETRHGTAYPIGLTTDSDGQMTLVLELIE